MLAAGQGAFDMIISNLKACSGCMFDTKSLLSGNDVERVESLVQAYQRLAEDARILHSKYRDYNSTIHRNIGRLQLFKRMVDKLDTLVQRVKIDMSFSSNDAENIDQSLKDWEHWNHMVSTNLILLRASFRFSVPNSSVSPTINFQARNYTPPHDIYFRHGFEAKLKAAILGSTGVANPFLNAIDDAGIGQREALLGIVHENDVRAFFNGGVYLISLGVDATLHDLIRSISAAVQVSAGEDLALLLRKGDDLETILLHITLWFHGRACLFIFDDVHQTSTINRSVLEQLKDLRESHSRSRLVFLSRNDSVSPGKTFVSKPLAPRHDLAMDILLFAATANREEPAARRDILRLHGGVYREELQHPERRKIINRILDICDGVPIRLRLVGGSVRAMRMGFGGNPWARYWGRLHDVIAHDPWARDRPRLIKAMAEDEAVNLWSDNHIRASFQISLDALEHEVNHGLRSAGDKRLTYHEMHRAFSAFQKHEEFGL